MSFNRGTKRNSFGNRNYNRNSGGGGGNIGSSVGLGSVGGGGSRGVNPWESGLMPGRGILPTPGNNLSLNSPEAQLVIATNLLSNLFRAQQDSHPQVPSLLSLGNNMNGPGSNNRNSQNFSGRFNDRQVRGNAKNQRSQPYNKMGNRARDGVAGRRGPSSAQQSRASQSGNQRMNGKEHRNDKSSKANASKKDQTVKKEQQDTKTSDNEKAETQANAKSDENDKDKDIKEEPTDQSDSKDGESAEPMETNEDEEKSLDDTQKDKDDGEKNDAKTPSKSPSKKGDNQPTSGKKSEARHAESRYAAVPISQMFCHVCNKHMWDGFSFENHLRGRAHQLMMDKLDESYKLRVDYMRHELKVSEEQRELNLFNSKRRGKKVSVDLSVREYCTMCDLHFYGTLSSHRKSDKHQQLKVFLHPRCGPCSKEFPSRIEYDEHCLTPGHMSNAVQTEEQKKTKRTKLPKGESEVRSAEDEEKDSGADAKTTDKEEELPENTEYLMDIVEDIDMKKYKIPSFRYCRQNHVGLGASLVKEVQGYQCEKCRRFMLTADDMNAHLRSITHYRNFVSEIKSLTAAAEANTSKDNEESAEGQDDESKTTNDDSEEVASKRRKLNESATEDSSATKESDENTEQAADGTSSPKKGNEKYDPLEADGDSEDDQQQKEDQDDDQVKQDDESKDQNKSDPSMDAWEDGDNENEPEVGNLLGDDDEMEEEKPQPQQDQPTQNQQDKPAQNLQDKPTQNQPDKPTQNQPDKPTQNQPDKPTQNQPDKPTQNQPDKPTQNQQDKPTLNQQDKPTQNQQDKPTQNQQDKPTQNQQVKPTPNQQDKPTLNQQVKPTLNQQVKPILNQQVKPILNQQVKPILNQQVKPTQNQQDKPPQNQQVKPTQNQQDKPPQNQQVKPTQNQQDKPTQNQQVKPTQNQQDKPTQNQPDKPTQNQQEKKPERDVVPSPMSTNDQSNRRNDSPNSNNNFSHNKSPSRGRGFRAQRARRSRR